MILCGLEYKHGYRSVTTPYTGIEPTLAASPGDDGWPCPGTGLERHRPGGRSSGLPAVHLGGLVSAPAAARRTRDYHAAVAAARAGSRHFSDVRSPTGPDGAMQPQERFSARPLHLSVLRRPTWECGTDYRSRGPTIARGRLKLGELCPGLCDVQPAQSEPDPRAGGPGPPQKACPPSVAAALRDMPRADRQLVALSERGVLECRTDLDVIIDRPTACADYIGTVSAPSLRWTVRPNCPSGLHPQPVKLVPYGTVSTRLRWACVH